MKVYLVGAGPGDPGLVTLKAVNLLENADVVIYDALANCELLNHAREGAELVYVGKVADSHALPQEKINALLAEKALANGGQNVVRLKGGDPYIFGRGGEEAEYLTTAGIPFEEVPGISSAIAAPAYAGIPLTHRDYASSVTIVTGHENPDKGQSSHNWKALAASGSTLVFVMGMRNIAFICDSLQSAGLDANMPAAIVYRGTTPMQRVLVSTVGELAAEAVQHNLTNPAVIVIGKVAALHDTLDWFSRKPLLGRRIVVTRAREQASGIAAMLSGLGADVTQCPMIEIAPLDDYSAADAAIGVLDNYKWIIFTSVNGVKYFWQRLSAAGLDSRALGTCHLAAIGPATARALAAHGLKADMVPKTYVAESVASELLARVGDTIAGMRILLPRAAKARMVLPDELAKNGAIVDVVPVYTARPDGSRAQETRALLESGLIDCIVFGSSSTVENFLDFIPASLLLEHPETALAAIGPVTSDTLRKNGLRAAIMPEEYTIPALVDAIVRFHGSKNAQELN